MRWLFLLTLATALAACSNRQEGAAKHETPLAEARVEHQRAAGVAYQHDIELEVAAAQMRQVAASVQQACAALPGHGCTLLEASIRSGTAAGATIRMRIAPDGVNTVLRVLDGQARVVAQSTTGEDLVEPIQDGERKMGMLVAYRDQLQALARQRALDADALIKLHRELAEVQSQIDNAATAQAQLHRRVDTELLTVAMHEHAKAAHPERVREALEDFGEDLLRGVAMLITFVASTLPFAIAGAAVYAVWRRVRKGRRAAAGAPDKR